MNINEVRIAGRLSKDVELRYTASNVPVASFTVATNRRVKNKDTGAWEDSPPTFADVTAWAKSAEAINQHFRKGDEIYVEGRLDNENWETREGDKRSKLKVTLESFQFVGPKQGREPQAQGKRPQQVTATRRNAPADDGWGHEPVDESDVPF